METDRSMSRLTAVSANWTLPPEGHVNHELVTNFASRSLHDLAVVGKAISTGYYDREPAYSYFNGCPAGGRQGYMEAQQYANDFDGILANCPAISWPEFIPAQVWPQVVMQITGVFPTQNDSWHFTLSPLLSAMAWMD
ncbi:unnamed protein product [Penicillium glandicola]